MKFTPTITFLAVVIGTSLVSARGDEFSKRDAKKPIAIGMQMQHLGHGIWVSGSFKSQDSGWSEHNCYIGYQEATGPQSTRVVPIIKLAALTNDSYVIKIEGDELIVSKRASGKEVMRIDITHLRIPADQAEQAGAGQRRK